VLITLQISVIDEQVETAIMMDSGRGWSEAMGRSHPQDASNLDNFRKAIKVATAAARFAEDVKR
jgi:hypothetical protein